MYQTEDESKPLFSNFSIETILQKEVIIFNNFMLGNVK